ncbi:CocE/NonD family hydrolase [Streptomyces sp. NBC_00075]|uniref:CocE/NonD family hydrolase n=1 Tax=Streptomyces sp. NBC_00075 TaxID=2975641 RepID=UPI00324C8BC6
MTTRSPFQSPRARVGTADPGASWTLPAARFGVTVVNDQTITMSDGVRIVGDIAYPADLETGAIAEGEFPVLLSQTPYTGETAESNDVATAARYFTERGYIYAKTCIRGTGRSGGEFVFWSPQIGADGVELADWAAALPGSNGTVGLVGFSYLGIAQLYTAAALGPDSPVKAMVPACAGGDVYRSQIVDYGGMPSPIVDLIRTFGQVAGDRAGAIGVELADAIAAGEDEAYFRDYWRSTTVGDEAQAIVDSGVPILQWTGWDDPGMPSTLELYSALQNASAGRDLFAPMRASDSTDPRYQVVVGPWQHGVGLSDAATLAWLETWMSGAGTGLAESATPLHLWEKGTSGDGGTGSWLETSAYPLVSDYSIAALGDGTLETTVPTATSTTTVDWAQPTETGASVSYDSEPFAEGLTLAGPVAATVWASSSSTNLRLITTLDDVAPDGTTSLVSNGNLVAGLRDLDEARTWTDSEGRVTNPYHTFLDDSPLTPGEAVKLSIRLDPVITDIEPGHSLRLTITTQEPGPILPTPAQRATLPGVYTIHSGGAYDSALTLPVVPYRSFDTVGSGEVPAAFVFEQGGE